MKGFTLLLSTVLTVAGRSGIQAFTVVPHPFRPSAITSTSTTPLYNMGGKGWENDNFLDSLSGNPEDREKANQEYQDYKKTREAFVQRNAARLSTPEGQRFLQQQQQQQQRGMVGAEAARDDILQSSADNTMDPFAQLGGSSGGSRLKNMMEKSKQRASPNNDMPWDQPKLFDLDAEDHAEGNDDTEETSAFE